MKSGCNPLIYQHFDNPELRKAILDKCDNLEIKNHIEELYKLIHYQMITIHDQRIEIIAYKHKNAWNKYDSHNLSNTFDETKPSKRNNESC